jgi:hypothetical protein
MTVRRLYSIRNNQLIIDLPDNFKGKQKVMVTLEDHIDSKAEKLELLQKASKDPLFIADIKEVNDDFGAIENDIV